LESLLENDSFIKIWQESVIIIDEYDWFIFDGSTQSMHKTFESLAKAV
jgi:archaellum biogenesis ATPase FlaH